MRKELLLAVLFTAVSACPCQVSVRTRAFSFGKPVLEVRGEFLGEDGAAWLNANAGGTLTLSISNSGAATARGAVVTLSPGAQLKDVQIVRTDTVGDIQPGETHTEKISVSAPGEASSQKGPLSITVKAGPGPVAAGTTVEITVRAIPAPRLDIMIAGAESGVNAGEVSKITARVRNTGNGEARGVSASFRPAGPKTEPGLAEMGRTIPLGTIPQGSSKEMTLTLKPAATARGEAAFVARLDEQREKFSVSETLSVRVNSPLAGAEHAGFEAFRKGNYNQAIASFEKIVAGGKASKEVYFSLGFSYFKNRKGALCLANMQKSSGLGSDEATAWLRENTTPVEVATVTYKHIDTDPFAGYSPPIGLGVLPFTDPLTHDTPLTQKIYDALKAKNETFRIFPYSTIRSEQASWGLTALSPSNIQILNALEKQLSMNFAVQGIARDTLGSVFSMQIIRCRDGALVFSQEFRTTGTSTAIDDAVMLLLKGKVPLYSGSRNVEVKFP